MLSISDHHLFPFPATSHLFLIPLLIFGAYPWYFLQKMDLNRTFGTNWKKMIRWWCNRMHSGASNHVFI